MGYRISWNKQTLIMSLLGVIFLLAVLLTWGVMQQKRAVPQPSPIVGEKIDPTSPIVIKDISYQEHEGGRLLCALRADEFKIHPRTFGVFSIQPIKEATFTNAVIEVYPSIGDNHTGEVDLFPFSFGQEGGKRLSTEGIGLITRGVIKKLHLNIYNGEELTIAVTANEAIVNFTKKETVLRGAQIEHKASRKFIKAQKVVWDTKKRMFKIPGEYTAVTPKGTAKGYGIKVNLDFKVEKMSS